MSKNKASSIPKDRPLSSHSTLSTIVLLYPITTSKPLTFFPIINTSILEKIVLIMSIYRSYIACREIEL